MSKEFISPMSEDQFLQSYPEPESKEDRELKALFITTIEAMDKIAIGPYCWIICGLPQLRILAAGGLVHEITGLSASEFVALPHGIKQLSQGEDIEPTLGFVHHSLLFRSQFPLKKRNELFISYYFRVVTRNTTRWMVLKTVEERIRDDDHYLLAMIMDVSHLKKDGPVLMTIFDAASNQTRLFETVTTNFEPVVRVPQLTFREREVLRYIARGSSSKQIAGSLGISQKTVENHRSNILTKTNCTSSAAAISFAMQNGLI